MDANLKAKWVEALRSGKYKQTTEGFFKYEGRFCCLGVLCVVAGQPALLDNDGGNWPFVDNEAGLDGISMLLATMNDEGSSFPDIADWIEANIPGDQPLAQGEDAHD
jgi:hypothetical protein